MNDMKWLKTLPNGWQIKKMPQVAKWSSGGTPKATEKSYYEGGSIPWLIIGDLNDGIVTQSASKITELGLQNSSAKMIPIGTLLVAMYGSIGKLGITGIECCTNQAIAFAKELHGISVKYLFYYLMFIKSNLISKGKGGTQKNISLTVLNSMEVIVPPLSEQERIVDKIEELLSQLDSSVDVLKKIKVQLKLYRKSILSSITTSNASFEVVEISELVDDIRIGPFGTVLHKEDYVTGGIPVINPQHIKGQKIIPNAHVSVSLDKAKELSSYVLRENDIIMGRRGEMGRTAAITSLENGWICGTGSILFRLKSDYDAQFYSSILASPHCVHYLEDNATGTTMKNLNEDIVKHIPVPRITKEQQKSIMDMLSMKMSICDNLEQVIDLTLLQAEAMRQSILKKAFEGELL